MAAVSLCSNDSVTTLPSAGRVRWRTLRGTRTNSTPTGTPQKAPIMTCPAFSKADPALDQPVYAIDARRGNVLWKTHVGTAVALAIVDSTPTLGSGCGDINPIGITGTPVIDPAPSVSIYRDAQHPSSITLPFIPR